MASGRKKTRITIDGKSLAASIKRKGISQKELADEVNLSRETVNRAIKHNIIDPLVLDDICRVLNVSPKYITGEERVKRNELVAQFKSTSKYPDLIESTVPPADEDGYIIFSYDKNAKTNTRANDLFILWLDAAASADIGYFDNVPSARKTLLDTIDELDDFQISTLQDKLITSIMHYIDEGKLNFPEILDLLTDGDE